MKEIKLSPAFIGFLQTAGFLGYIAIFGAIMINASALFGPLNNSGLLGPMLLLSLFVFSAIFCASVILAYPFYVFWEKKDFKTAVKIVANSVFWLFLFIIGAIICLILK